MNRATMTESSLLQSWLQENNPSSQNGRYVHRLLRENRTQREYILAEIKDVFDHAHSDAKRHIRCLLADNLDPLGEYAVDPAAGYPEKLDIVTLQGYFGEIMAGVLSEALAHFGETGWKVPAYLFRFHALAFGKLELMRQTGSEPGIIPGRTGEDCIAFLCNEDHRIVASLICEAKCTLTHDSGLISEAHRQASSSNPKPLYIVQIIEVLRDHCTEASQQWITSLRNLYHQDSDDMYERCDMICYVCGRSPTNRNSWIPDQQPHSAYSGGRKLEAVEVHLDDVRTLIHHVYGITEP